MKKVFLAILILSVKFSYSQQCKLSFTQLVSLSTYNLSEFDTFALKNGFSFNAKEQTYFCDSKVKGRHNSLSRNDQPEFTIIIYSLYNKKEYLSIKEILEMGELTGTQNEKETLRLRYLYKGKIVILQTTTYTDGINTYMVSVTTIK